VLLAPPLARTHLCLLSLHDALPISCSLPTVLLYALVPLPDHLLPFGPIPVLGLLFWGGSSGIVFWMIGIAGDSAVSLRSLFDPRSEEHTSELQSRGHLVCRLLLEKT